MRHMILPSLVSKPTGSVRSRLPMSPRWLASRLTGVDQVLPPSVLRIANAWVCTAPHLVTGSLHVECRPSPNRTSVPSFRASCQPVSIFAGSLGHAPLGLIGATFPQDFPLSFDSDQPPSPCVTSMLTRRPSFSR